MKTTLRDRLHAAAPGYGRAPDHWEAAEEAAETAARATRAVRAQSFADAAAAFTRAAEAAHNAALHAWSAAQDEAAEAHRRRLLALEADDDGGRRLCQALAARASDRADRYHAAHRNAAQAAAEAEGAALRFRSIAQAIDAEC